MHKCLIITVLLLVCGSSYPQTNFHALIEVYQSESTRMSQSSYSSEQTTAFREKWLLEFLSAIDENPPAEFRGQMQQESVALATSVGEYEIADQIGNQVLQNSSDRLIRIRWNTELGEIAEMHFHTTKNLDEALRADAYFESAIAGVLESENPALLADRSPNIVRDVIVSYYRRAKLAASVFEDHKRSAMLFRDGSDILSKFAQFQISEIESIGYSQERLLTESAIQFFFASDIEGAFNVLSDMNKIPDLTKTASGHLGDIITTQLVLSNEAYRDVVNGWMALEPSDFDVPTFKLQAAMNYEARGRRHEAHALFYEIYRDHEDYFLTIDTEAINTGGKGYYALVLRPLFFRFHELGDNISAIEVGEKLVSLFPNDERAQAIKAMLDDLLNNKRAETSEK